MKPLDPAFVPHLAPAQRPLALGLVAGTAQGLLAVAQAFAIGTLVVRLVTGSGDWHSPALWLMAVVLGRALAGWVVDTSGARAATLVSSALRRRLLASAAQLDPLELSGRRTGELTTLATRGTSAVEPYLTRYLPSLVLAAVLPAATVIAIFALDWIAGLIIVLTLPLVPLFAILIGQNTQSAADRQWREMGDLAGHFLDVVRGLPTLVAHRRATAQSRTIREVTHRHRRATLETLKIAFASSVALELIATLSVALVAVIVGLRLAGEGLDFQTALIVLLLAPEAYWPLRRVGAEFHAAAEGSATFASAIALLADADRALPDPDRRPVRGTGPVITLDTVGLTYPGRERAALAPVSAVLPRRGLVAVTGPSGAGKSTLLALVAGELTSTTGHVLLDGVPLNTLDLDSWRRQVATAPQRPWLTAGTVAENLRLGRPDATDVDLLAALATVDLDDVVRGLDLGLDTPLGEDGAGLSAGQRARLGLARVVLSERPVVLLDEPSAHLDAVTEAVLIGTLRLLAEDRLVVVVAHRQAVVDAADQLVEVVAPAATDQAEEAPTDTSVLAHPSAVRDAPRPRAVRSPDSEPELVPARFGLRTGTFLGTLSVISGVALTATAAWLITRASEHPPVMYLMVAIVGVRAFGLGRPIFRYAERLVSHDAAFRQLAERRAHVYDALVPLVPGRLGVRRGDVLASVVDDVDSLVDEQLRVRQPRTTAWAVSVVAVLFAGAFHPVAGILTLLVCLSGLAAFLLTRHRVAQAEEEFVDARAALSTSAEGWFASVRQYVAWGAADGALAQVDAASLRLGRAAGASVRATAFGRAVIVLSSGVGLLATAVVMDRALATGSVSPAMAALLVMLPLALADALLPVVDAAALEVRTRAAHARLDALDALVPAVDPEAGRPTPLAAHPDLALEDVSVGWGEAPAVTGLSLPLTPGRRIGLVGPSGTGKSTVAALLLRFLDPSHGQLAVDGTAARTLLPDVLRERVGLVDDDPYLFSSNVLENVRLARPDAGDAEVVTALQRAHLGDWIAQLPQREHTLIGEGNAHVSGGERARLALARALLAEQPVLVLDEPTAHLDAATAREVSEELLADEGRTVLWITHGTVGLDRMDEVVTLQGTRTGTRPEVRVGV